MAGCGEDSGIIGETGMGASVEGSVVLRFTAIPDEKLTEQRLRFRSVVAVLEERLNLAVDYVPSNNYGAAVDMFRNRDIHLAWLGGLTGVQARKAVPGARAIAQGVEDPDFYSYFIAHRKLGLARSNDFPMSSRGRSLSFGSELSTSGRLMPEHFIRAETGLAPGDFYSEVGFSGSHSETLALVNAGAFDLGVIDYRVYDAAPPEAKANTLILWQTPNYPDYHFVVQPDLDDVFGNGFTDDLQEALVTLSGEVCERAFSRSGLIPAANEQFAVVEEVARSVGLVR